MEPHKSTAITHQGATYPRSDTSSAMEHIVPVELYGRLLYWLEISLPNQTSDPAIKPFTTLEVLADFRRFAQIFFQLHGRDYTALTVHNLSSSLSFIHQQGNGGTPLGASAILLPLGYLYGSLHEQHGQLEDINLAIECHTLAVLRIPGANVERPTMFSNLGGWLLLRFEVTGELSDLDLSLEYSTQAISLTSNGHPHRPAYLNNISQAYLKRFAHSGLLQDLDPALECFVQLISLMPDNHADKCKRLNSLGALYSFRYKGLSADPADLDAAIEYYGQANQLVSNEHPDKPKILDGLGASYRARHERLGGLADINATIWCSSQTVLLTPDGHPLKPTYMSALGRSYGMRYERLGRLPDIDAAISYQSQALQHFLDEREDGPLCLGNLGGAYVSRFHRLGQMTDLDAAIDCLRRALLLTSDSHPNKTFYLNNLGGACTFRYRRIGELADLELAISSCKQAVLRAPDDYQYKPMILCNLGSSYGARYLQSGELLDLELGIQYQQEAAVLSDKMRTTGKHIFLHNLAKSYHARYMLLSEPKDLDLAINRQRLAILETPGGHFTSSGVLVGLGEWLSARFSSSQDYTDLSESIECFKQAACSTAGDPEDRSDAARQWALQSFSYQPQHSLEAFQCFISLIPQVVWLGMAIERRYTRVAKIADVTLLAALLASLLGKHGLALEWLEQGRSIVWNQLLQLRSPLDELHVINPMIAGELEQVASELRSAAALRPSFDGITDEGATQRHRRLVERWEWLVQQAQSLPGMSGFLAPKAGSQLAIAAQTRAIVVVVVSRYSPTSCALVLRQQATEVDVVPLGNLSYEKAVRAREQLLRDPDSAVRAERKFTTASKSDNRHKSVLNMLWADIAKPVLEFLGYTEALPPSELPHVTWCTTGPLSFLPVHTAGDYTKQCCSVFDYCVSSYTPTLSALLAPPVNQGEFSGIAMVSQASTHGLAPLPGTIQELGNIVKQAEGFQNTRLDGESATCEAVLDAMGRHSWVHLACHASQDRTNPIASAFHLHDGPLDLATITQKHRKHADLAFLSACQTATGDQELSEEAIHLASGMIMAGYRTVLATMWPISDQDAPLVADKFYEYMLKDGVPDSRKAARALHYAVGCLRTEVGVDAYKRWAPYIHIGI